MNKALMAGASGLIAHQNLLDVIGDNIANVNTLGFKGSNVRFESMFADKISPELASTSTRGSVNPAQIGYGVSTGAINIDFSQGSLKTSENPLDMAIQGEGFFCLNDGVQDYYTRAGNFRTDVDNIMVDTATGYKVLDVTGSEIEIPYSEVRPARETTTVGFHGNLSAAALGPAAQTLTTRNPLETGGAPAVGGTNLNALDTNTVPYIAGDIIHISGREADSSVVNDTFTYGADGTTVQDLINKINGAYTSGAVTLDANGNLALTATNQGVADMALSLFDDAANTGAAQWNNHAFLETQEGRLGDNVTTSIGIYDSQGQLHALTMVLTKTADNTWELVGSIPPEDGSMVAGQDTISNITFYDDGSYAGVVGGSTNLGIQFNGITNPQVVTLDFGTAGDFDGMTQFGNASTVVADTQDGAANGQLSDVTVMPDGTIQGIFTNGDTTDVATVQVTTFTNPGGLLRDDNSLYRQSIASGDPIHSQAQSGRAGSIVGNALEQSNIELAEQFTDLITGQRGFQANARTVTTADQVLQELVNLVR